MSITSIPPASARFIYIFPLPGAEMIDMDYNSRGLLQTSNRNPVHQRLKNLNLFRLNTIGYYSLGLSRRGIIYASRSMKFTLTALVLCAHGPYGPLMISFDCPQLGKSQCIRVTAHSPNRDSDTQGRNATHRVNCRHIDVFPSLVHQLYMCSTHSDVSNICHRMPAHPANLSSFFFFSQVLYSGKWHYNVYSLSTKKTYLWQDIYLLCRRRKEGAGQGNHLSPSITIC